MEECTICLDPITPACSVGVVTGCRHHYHHDCVFKWSQHSNSCPTCRIPFHSIQKYATSRDKHPLTIFPVTDRILATDAINSIPDEYVIRAAAAPPAAVQADSYAAGVCTICSSASYSLSRTRSTTTCELCSAVYHVVCLGLRQSDPEWYCPTCDTLQDLVIVSARNQRSTTNSILNRFSTPTSSRVNSHDINIPSNEVDTTSFNTTSFDSPTSFSSFVSSPQHPVLNGGVILRREMRQNETLTQDEIKSWDLFQRARSNEDFVPEVAPAVVQRKKRPRKQREIKSEEKVKTTTSASSISTTSSSTSTSISTSSSSSSSSSSPSRIAGLIGQLKSKPVRSPNYPSSPVPSHLPSVYSPVQSPDSETDVDVEPVKKQCLQQLQELTLEQKTEIQKHVRNILRPLYKPHSDPGSPGVIPSQDAYININKTVSRKLYAAILADASEQIDYFCDEKKLEQLVTAYVKTELTNITM